jgi:peptide/nickel transport system ATP-binding protein
MREQDNLLVVENLYTNFYTYQGVVKALDGIDFTLAKRETFGLVGETGCGKSVTANCVLRLIPSPPGKIERGSIYFMPPDGTEKEIGEIQARIQNLRGEKDFKEGDPRLNSLEQEMAEQQQVRRLKAEIANLEQAMTDPKDPKLVQLKTELAKVLSRYDLLNKSPSYMRKIRGKYISMIFQEPMSALNPVFPAGNQISEVLLLHERKELALATIRSIDNEIKAIDSFKRADRVATDKGEFKCKSCGALMAKEEDVCPQCGASFVSDPMRSLRKIKLRYYRRFYRKMAVKPDAMSLRISSKVPILRRYEKPIKAEAMERAERMLRLVRIPDPKNVVNSYPHELSGGMQQRVMIAMALACKPQLLIADEPTTALDVTVQAQILKLMKDLQEETGTSILLITHNLGVVAETCDRVGVMYAGVMAEIGPVKSIFKDPLHPYTQGLINSIPNLSLDISRLDTIEGNVPNLVKPPPGCRFHPRCFYAMEVCKNVKPPTVEVKPDHVVSCHLYTGVGK